MKRTVGTTRKVVAGMILVSGALGIFGGVKLAATNQAFPRIPRTEQEQTARVQKGDAVPGTMKGLSFVARGRSGETDPCVPIAPVTFSARGAVMC
jgi:hypothetical protein